jgi:hypothetical protein
MTHTVLFIRHSGKVIRGRTGQTCESDVEIIAPTGLHFKGPRATRRPLRTVPKTGLSICRASSKVGFTIASARIQNGFHGQASPQFDPKGPAACSPSGAPHQRLGGVRAASGAGPGQRTWLSPNAKKNCAAKIIICRIVMCPKSYLKFTTGWYLKRSRRALGPRCR